MEKRINNNEGSREDLIKANAFFDASEYVRLMQQKSRESLILEEGGGLVINTMEGGKIINNARKKLSLSSGELVLYLSFLGDKVKELIKNE